MKYVATILSQRYAQAFYNVYGKRLTLQDIERIKKTAHHIDMHREALALFSLPHCTENAKEQMMKVLLRPLGETLDLVQPLCNLLIADQRTVLIALVLQAIADCYDQNHAIERFVVTTSHAIDVQELDALRSFLEQQTDKTIEIKYHINQSLIAGIRMQSDTHVWEYSVRRQLQQLQGVHIG